MSSVRSKTIMLAPLLVALWAHEAGAEDQLAEEIVRALTGTRVAPEERLNTRSLGARSDDTYTPRSFVVDRPARLRPTRRIETVTGTLRIQPAEDRPAPEPAEPSPPPSYDLYVTFPFASHELTDAARRTLGSVATALDHPALRDKRIRVAGHTDSVGTDVDNLKLSEARAEAVRSFLHRRHGIDPARIETVGYGETRLKDPQNPTAGVNRRVELVNLGAMSARTQ